MLISQGVQHPHSAVASALTRGAKLADIQRIVEHFRSMPEAWQPGALQSRVKSFHPDQAPDEGWPEPSAKWVTSQQKRQYEEAKLKAQAEERKRKERSAKQTTDYENRYGSIIDSMTPEQADQLIGSIDDQIVRQSARKLYANVLGVRSKSLRSIMFRELEKQDAKKTA